MRAKFDRKYWNQGYRWLAVRERPLKGSPIVRKIEIGLEFDVEDEAIDDGEGNLWYHVTYEPTGYVMAEFVSPVSEDVKAGSEDATLQKMKVSELRNLAEESGIKLKATMNKAQIIEALLNG